MLDIEYDFTEQAQTKYNIYKYLRSGNSNRTRIIQWKYAKNQHKHL